jgi:hypothetical protein
LATFGWFSSGRDQAAIDLLEAVCRQMDRGFIQGLDLTPQVEEFVP